MFSVSMLLVVIAFALTLIGAVNGKVPLWIPMLLVCIALMVGGAGLVVR